MNLSEFYFGMLITISTEKNFQNIIIINLIMIIKEMRRRLQYQIFFKLLHIKKDLYILMLGAHNKIVSFFEYWCVQSDDHFDLYRKPLKPSNLNSN